MSKHQFRGFLLVQTMDDMVLTGASSKFLQVFAADVDTEAFNDLLSGIGAVCVSEQKEGNGSNCGFIAVGQNLNISTDAARAQIADAAPDAATRTLLMSTSTWLRWGHLVHFSRSHTIISLSAMAATEGERKKLYLHGRVAMKGKERPLFGEEAIMDCIRGNPDAVVLYCQNDVHWMKVAMRYIAVVVIIVSY